jgi:hypothetical protein
MPQESADGSAAILIQFECDFLLLTRHWR